MVRVIVRLQVISANLKDSTTVKRFWWVYVSWTNYSFHILKKCFTRLRNKVKERNYFM